MATVVPRLKKRRISPHASGDATSPSTSQRGMIDASYMPISSPMHDVPMYYSAPSSDIHASSYPAASASDVMLNQPLPSGPDAPSHPRPRMCIHEIINGQEQPVYVVSDDDDDDDGPPPASPLQGHAPLASTRPAINAGSKRKSPVPWESIEATPMKRRRRNDAPGAPVDPAAASLSQLPSLAAFATVPAPTAVPVTSPAQMPPSSGMPELAPSFETTHPDAWRLRCSGPDMPRANFTAPLDDKDGHIIVREGEFITPRYQIRSLLGQGTFGKVVQCYDRKLGKNVAIKVIRAVQKYRDASQIEIRVLQCLRQHDPLNRYQCVQLLESFDFRNHICIVFDLLDCSVFDFLKNNKFQPFPCRDIWLFAKQLLRSVAYMHRLSLIHTDLKPENVLLVDASSDVASTSRRSNARKKRVLRSAEIRLIDFGSATFSNEYHSGVVSTRHYRAPEIILGMGWSFPCDVWSLGCILVEFYTGEALFQTHDNLEHLAMMEMVLGKLPDDYRRKAETYKPEYFYHGRLDYPRPDTSKQSRRFVQSMKPLQDIVASPPAYAKHHHAFVSLLRRLLEFDPAKRITVEEALTHPYFQLDPHDFPP